MCTKGGKFLCKNVYGYAKENLSLKTLESSIKPPPCTHSSVSLSLFSFLSSVDLKEGLLVTMESIEDPLHYLLDLPLLGCYIDLMT